MPMGGMLSLSEEQNYLLFYSFSEFNCCDLTNSILERNDEAKGRVLKGAHTPAIIGRKLYQNILKMSSQMIEGYHNCYLVMDLHNSTQLFSRDTRRGHAIVAE